MAAEYHEKVRASKGTELKGDYTIHATMHVLVCENGSNYIGIAECSDSDEFRKATGESIARGRAEKAMAIAHGWLDAVGDFDIISVLAPSGAVIKGRIWVPDELEEELEDDSVEVSEVVARC